MNKFDRYALLFRVETVVGVACVLFRVRLVCALCMVGYTLQVLSGENIRKVFETAKPWDEKNKGNFRQEMKKWNVKTFS